MNLNGTQRRQLYDAILDAFRKSDLEQLTLFEFGKSLEAIAGGSNTSEIVTNLIEYVEKQGITQQLLEALIAERPNKPSIQGLSRFLPTTTVQLKPETPLSLANLQLSALSDRADVLLVTVNEIETASVLQLAQNFTGISYERKYTENATYYQLGVIGEAKVWLVRSGMGEGGTRGATLTVADAISELEAGAIILVGVAFGMKTPDKQPIGQILVARQIFAYDPAKLFQSQSIPRGDKVSSSSRMQSRFEDGCLEWEGADVEFGLVISGSKLVNDQAFRDRILEGEQEAIGGEMEGAGLYAAAASKKKDWILVKAVCDYGDGNKDKNKDENQQVAARNAAEFVLHVINRGGFIYHKEGESNPKQPPGEVL